MGLLEQQEHGQKERHFSNKIAPFPNTKVCLKPGLKFQLLSREGLLYRNFKLLFCILLLSRWSTTKSFSVLTILAFKLN